MRELTTEKRACLLCNRKSIDTLKYGPLIEKNGIVAHQYCLLFSWGLEQNGKDDDGILGFLESDISEFIRIATSKNCCYCSGSKASTKCSKANCSAVFHYPCGLENGSLHQFHGRFNSFCFAHRPRQRISQKSRDQARESLTTCLICLEFVDCDDVNDTIWASCCRFAWYHRDCLQRFALSSGYLFKCVLCRNKRTLRALLLRIGIYMPKRDASWETTPDAYRELYIRHNQCDAGGCKCPLGRAHVGDKQWKLVLCSSCGSQGVHAECAGLTETEWECDICRTVSSKFESTPL